MAKGTIDYKSYRWEFFSELAGSMNPDLEEARLAKSWARKDPAWKDLREAVQQLYLDPIVQAVADMSGESFDRMRQITLERAEKIATKNIEYRLSVISEGIGPRDRSVYYSADNIVYSLRFLYEVDPLLFAWTVASYTRYHCRLAEENGRNPLSGRSAFWRLPGTIKLLEILNDLMDTFRMTEKAAKNATMASIDALREIEYNPDVFAVWTRQAILSVAAMLSEARYGRLLTPASKESSKSSNYDKRAITERAHDAMTGSMSMTRRRETAADKRLFKSEMILEPLKSIQLYPPTPRSLSSGALSGSSALPVLIGAGIGAAATLAASRMRR